MWTAMTREERRAKEAEENARRERERERERVLRKIKFQKLQADKSRCVKTFSQVKYVMGKYDPQSQVYSYKTFNGWGANLQHAIIYDYPPTLSSGSKSKSCKFCVSKVFVKVVSVYQKGQEDGARNHVDTVSLTKPNHYEMLSAVINNI
jgi:hypothetical protein